MVTRTEPARTRQPQISERQAAFGIESVAENDNLYSLVCHGILLMSKTEKSLRNQIRTVHKYHHRNGLQQILITL